MSYTFQIHKNTNSKLSTIDFDNLPFGKAFSDHMFVADYKDGKWGDYRIEPFANFSISPAAMALHYGQALFEGMKAFKKVTGEPVFFRPELHAVRLNESAARLSMPAFPEDVFVDALHTLIDMDKDWIPPKPGSGLYIRPFMFATEEAFGVKPAKEYKFIIFTGPVGPYYPKPISLWAEQKYVRAVVGGTGEAKAAGNYAGSLLPTEKAIARGYDQVMWMDAHEFKYIQEVGTMNIFFVIDGKVITPAADGAILKGITRKSVLHILKDNGYDVEIRPISIDEVVEAYKAGTLQEVFGTGTAVVVANVSKIGYQDMVLELPPVEEHKVAKWIKTTIDGMRAGTVEDKYGWIKDVKTPATVG